MKSASRNDLDNDSWRVYDYIARHFIATVINNFQCINIIISILYIYL